VRSCRARGATGKRGREGAAGLEEAGCRTGAV